MSAEALRCPECRSIFWDHIGSVASCMDCNAIWSPERPCVINNVTGRAVSQAFESVSHAVRLCHSMNLAAGPGGLYGVGVGG